MKYIKYISGFKYKLVEDYSCQTNIFPMINIHTDYIDLTISGKLTIRSGFLWDGPSGPAIDTKNFMRGSLIHDALYQLMREGLLDIKWRIPSDKELVKITREDGMSKIRCAWVFWAVKTFAKRNATKESERKIIMAP